MGGQFNTGLTGDERDIAPQGAMSDDANGVDIVKAEEFFGDFAYGLWHGVVEQRTETFRQIQQAQLIETLLQVCGNGCTSANDFEAEEFLCLLE
ncbi:MAG: hypothetical protein BWY63_03821 [Chloroflexi bacterium ADurb.Bin360]|nr:MAG: hypothetical protein BWY63_03821 [Chloroflexi bacterium ADurb.Bin360]